MFDNVCKYLVETFPADFAQWLLGEPLPLTTLSPAELSLEPIRADSLILLQAPKLLLHIEFQTQPDPAIPFRMLDYGVRVYRRFPDRAMRQVVIYLRASRSPLVRQTVFAKPHTRHEFQVIRLWEQPPATLLAIPGLLPLAVLGQTRDRAALFQQVATQIEIIPESRRRHNVAASAAVLAGLVLDKELIQRILRLELMRESVIYQDILAEGRAEGRVEGERSLVMRLLKRRFGELPAEVQSQIAQLSLAQLEALGDALLEFSGLQDLTQWLQTQSTT